MEKAGTTDGPALVEAMKGEAWESPRGPVSIDPQRRDIVQKRAEKAGNPLANIEFAIYANVKN